ncbi:MAG TPA: helix-turn-helix domain-containing protein [Bacteroidales bacterium]
MQEFRTIDDFYKRQESLGYIVTAPGDSNTNIGKFNVFRREMFYNKHTPYNRRDFYKICLLIGEGTLYYANKGIEINKDALLFFNPLIPYAWETKSEKQSGYCCLFTEDFITMDKVLSDSPFFKIGADPIFFLDQSQVNVISEIFEKMLLEISGEYRYKYDLLRNYVALIVHEALKMKPADSYFKYANASSRITSLFLELLERQFPVDSANYTLKLKTANDFALSLSVHVNHLNRAVKEITGRTTTWHITDRIMKEAQLLLKNTDWPIADIAWSLGFEYPSYFNNQFKKYAGKTPLNYRK